MHEEHDIVAQFSSDPAGSSTGALAAYLGRTCGHVLLDTRVIKQGYRFHPWLSDEIPHFFNKRLRSGADTMAVTLQAGFSIEGDDPFDGCESHAEAQAIVSADDYHGTVWFARVTHGVQLLDIADAAAPLFIAKHPSVFRALAEELVTIGVLLPESCPLCSEEREWLSEQ